MIVKVECEACGESLDLLRVHGTDHEQWGRAVLCFDEQSTLRAALKGHTGNRCAHIRARLEERRLEMLGEH